MDETENPTPLVAYGSRPGSCGRTNAAEAQVLEWEALANQQAEERQYLLELAGVDDLSQADSLQIVVNTTSSTVSHLSSLMPRLTELNLTGSVIDSVRDLGTGFRHLQVLWLARCGLRALDGIAALPSLKELYAAYNDVADLQALDSCTELEVLDLEGNCVGDVDAVTALQWCPQLSALTLAGNPIAASAGYRQAMLAALPSLQTLDDVSASADEASAAALLAGTAESVPGACHEAGSSAPLAAASGASEALPHAGGSGHSDPEELAFVAQGIKHARVGVDSQVRCYVSGHVRP